MVNILLFPLGILSVVGVVYLLGKVSSISINFRILLGIFCGLYLVGFVYQPLLSMPLINNRASKLSSEVVSAYSTSAEAVVNVYRKYNGNRFDPKLLTQQYEQVSEHTISKKPLAVYNKRVSMQEGIGRSSGYRSIHTFVYGVDDKYFVVQVIAENLSSWISPHFSILSTSMGSKAELGDLSVGEKLKLKDVFDN